MAILIDGQQRVIVQGITGREGLARTRLMKDYGTQIIGGVTPGKGGMTVEGVPVFDTVLAARDALGMIDISVLFIPAPLVKNAALEAMAAGVKLLVIVPDRVPIYDVLEIASAAGQTGAQFIGPNTLGVLSPGKGVLGMMGGQAASAREWFFPGSVGITSRSGGITTSTAYYLAKAGVGTSTLVHVGGDAVIGMPHADVLKRFEVDDETRAVVMFGEIGTAQEEEAADLIAAGGFTKPLIAYIGGRAAKEGTRFSHAGAIVEGNRGSYAGKVERLRAVNATIAETFADVPRLTRERVEALPSVHAVSKPSPPTPELQEEDKGKWKTAVTDIQPNAIRVRGYRLDEMMGGATFSQVIYLMLTGNLPSSEVGQMIDAMLVASIDHGVTPPSTLAARTAASTGAPYNAAIAAGLLSINQHHGGAIEDSMKMMARGLELGSNDMQAGATALVAEYAAAKKRLPGFGHRVHTADPRTARLLTLADGLHVAASGVAMVRALETALANDAERRLPINVDGAIAALLIDLALPTELANTFFMIARVPGLVAQIYEEKTRERPMRVIDPKRYVYDGHEPR